MTNARRIATLGVGFGALAVASIGFLGTAETSTQAHASSGGGGGVFYQNLPRRKVKRSQLNVLIDKAVEDYLEARDGGLKARPLKQAIKARVEPFLQLEDIGTDQLRREILEALRLLDEISTAEQMAIARRRREEEEILFLLL